MFRLEELSSGLNGVVMGRAAWPDLAFPITEVFRQRPEDHWRQGCVRV